MGHKILHRKQKILTMGHKILHRKQKIFNRFLSRVPPLVPVMELDMVTLPENLSSPLVLSEVDVASSFVFCVVFCGPLFIFFV
jgi:hypothetical protein